MENKNNLCKKTRQSNIECLRILATIGVIVLHYCSPKIGGGLGYVAEGSLNYYVMLLLVGCSICAVDLFIMISGFFLIETQTRNIWRVIEFIGQVVIFSLVFYFSNVLLGNLTFSWGTLIRRMIPANYFVILYCVVYLVSPFINKLMKSLDPKQLDLFMIVIFVLFSVYPTAVDILCELVGKQITGLSSVGAYGSQWGYSAINFFLMYCIGAYLKLRKLRFRSSILLSVFGACVLILTVWFRINAYVGYFESPTAYEYCNPFVIVIAVCLLMLFLKIKAGSVKWSKRISKGCFAVYLTHGHFIEKCGIEQAVNKNVFIMLLHITVVVLMLFAIGYISSVIYAFITGPAWRALEKKIKLPEIKVE